MFDKSISSMLNDLNVLIGIEIELKIRGSTLLLFTHKTYYQLFHSIKLIIYQL